MRVATEDPGFAGAAFGGCQPGDFSDRRCLGYDISSFAGRTTGCLVADNGVQQDQKRVSLWV